MNNNKKKREGSLPMMMTPTHKQQKNEGNEVKLPFQKGTLCGSKNIAARGLGGW